ncbi:ScaI family restriction endonuclease [Pseudoalteromonas rubra]|uniref:ScaI family restriction endonuclease n=1 Tax=Pseudoalteromonas rubra TaxID=43658 RepID=A0A4V2E3Z1_9GAMM|nr:ScaI family restriction endonuclease [Pseudoalteromonas rubra]RZM84182.1 ScaI family restriction endonuclease [Pseudoalteromonas rubra]
MAASPYTGKPVTDWLQVTHSLISQYPIHPQEILDVAMLSWDRLWASQIGGQISLDEVELPATVVGYFFQKLFAHELKVRYPNVWRGEELKSDKDLVNIQNPNFSTEMKSSGQLGYALFGNRSYNQLSESSTTSGKDKSGFYITVNFYRKAITLLRIGWIDQDDWIPQGAATGQAAVLKPEVYQYKLLEINGPYRYASPIELLNGIGPKSVIQFHNEGVYTFGDLKNYSGFSPKILKTLQDNRPFLNSF